MRANNLYNLEYKQKFFHEIVKTQIDSEVLPPQTKCMKICPNYFIKIVYTWNRKNLKIIYFEKNEIQMKQFTHT